MKVGFYNSTSLGTRGRTGASQLVSACTRSRKGSMLRIYYSLKRSERDQFYNSQALYLYGPNGSAPQRGLTGGLFG